MYKMPLNKSHSLNNEQHRTSVAGTHVKGCHGLTNPELAIKQVLRFKEIPGKTGPFNIRNASHPLE